MKKIKNILGVILVLIGMTTVYSCQDDTADYIPSEKVDSEQVYFPSTNAAAIKLSTTVSSYDIIIARVKTDNAISVPLTVTGGAGLFNVPASVSFAQGASTATIKITFDAEEVGFDNFQDLTISINNEFTSVYGKSEYKFNIGIPAPWKSLGNAIYNDDFVSAFFGVSYAEYEVEIQENLLQPGLFRLVNPYGAAYPFNDPGDWDDSQDWYLEINAVDPTAVFINVQEVGMDWGYGMFSFGSKAGLYMTRDGKTLAEVKAEGHTGTFENGIITFPPTSLLTKMANYQNGGLYGANGTGGFIVVMPGAVRTDYSISVDYLGRFADPNGSNYVVGDVALGADVVSAKVALVANNSTFILDNIVDDIDKNKIAAIEIFKSGVNIIAENEEDGDFILVAVSYDKDGVVQEVDTDSFEYSVSNVADEVKSLNSLSLRSAKIKSSKVLLNNNVRGAVKF